MPDLAEADRLLLERIQSAYNAAEQEHRQFRQHAAEYYSLYRGLQQFRSNNQDAPDRDVVVRAQKEWGAELFIPKAYQTVETIIARMFAHRPRMNPLPEDEEALGNVDNMRLVIDKQQRQISYEAVLQKIGKDGLICGLGVQKVGWRTKKRTVKGVQPSQYDPNVYVAAEAVEKCMFDDAYAEWVDPRRFMWDPYATEVEECEYVIHRVYRSEQYVRGKVERQEWRSSEWDPTALWTLEDLLRSGPTTQEDELDSERRQVEGYSTRKQGNGARHEVWEYHDGEKVICVLNGAYPVLVGDNPMPDGSLPFQCFRPTVVGGSFVGIGEIEPIRDLQYELNTLRGQRIDAATMALNRGYFFDETMVNQDDLIIGPNIGVPVNGPPREALKAMEIAEVPSSAYSESSAITADMESVTGIADSVSGGDAPQQTATGAQLVVQAASIRIQNKSKLMGQQVIIPGGNAFVLMNQLHILKPKPYRVEDEVGAHKIVRMGPNELRGLMSMNMDDGSTMAENVPQMRSDFQMWMGLLGNPNFNQQMVAMKMAECMGIKRPESLVVTEEQLPLSTIDEALQIMGVPPEAFVAAMDQLEAAQAEQQQLPQET